MSYEDKSRLTKLTERPSISNSIIKMWVLLEGKLDAVKLRADLSESKDLDDFKRILKNEIVLLKNVGPEDILFLDSNNTPLRPGIDLKSLSDNSTDINPLIVRYPLSNANIIVNHSYGDKHGSAEIPHTSGSLNLLREIVKRKYDLQTEDVYFFSEETKQEIINEHNFNILLSRIELNSNNYNLKLKVKVEGKKSYSDWELKDVFKEILKKNYKSLSGIPRFNLNDLPSLERPFTENRLKGFVAELQTSLSSLKCEFTNETTAREYISAFIKNAVCHIQDHINDLTQLYMELDLDGSHGYGPVDYMVIIVEILVLLCEAKAENMNKGAAQVLVQMHSAIEEHLNKRKRAKWNMRCSE
ncbi:hypothetical protein Glove_33g80 [Diversispora epigaea]|uniref:Uncharacterized protein n=1 Tax=Diversispora epigaea TaxID=1348612 RepID=A0A397JH19_9GLOM|nr:hypothetical protein Glove_33g80 [Diversispora epigaea]